MRIVGFRGHPLVEYIRRNKHAVQCFARQITCNCFWLFSNKELRKIWSMVESMPLPSTTVYPTSVLGGLSPTLFTAIAPHLIFEPELKPHTCVLCSLSTSCKTLIVLFHASTFWWYQHPYCKKQQSEASRNQNWTMSVVEEKNKNS